MYEIKKVQLYGHPDGIKEMKDMYNECQKYVQDMTAFGWQPTQETAERYGRTTKRYQIMVRETSIPNYNEYKKLEDEYESAKCNLKTYDGMEFSTVLLLLLLFIIPGVIYITVKVKQKYTIEDNNQECYSKMQKAVVDARKIK